MFNLCGKMGSLSIRKLSLQDKDGNMRSRTQCASVKYNANTSKETPSSVQDPYEHDLGLYDIPMNI